MTNTTEHLDHTDTIAEALFLGVLSALEIPFKDDGPQLQVMPPATAIDAADTGATLSTLAIECARFGLSQFATPAFLANPELDANTNQENAATAIRAIHKAIMMALDAQAVKVLADIAGEHEISPADCGRFLSGQWDAEKLLGRGAPEIVLPH